jgi:hypothetical protein
MFQYLSWAPSIIYLQCGYHVEYCSKKKNSGCLLLWKDYRINQCGVLVDLKLFLLNIILFSRPCFVVVILICTRSFKLRYVDTVWHPRFINLSSHDSMHKESVEVTEQLQLEPVPPPSQHTPLASLGTPLNHLRYKNHSHLSSNTINNSK